MGKFHAASTIKRMANDECKVAFVNEKAKAFLIIGQREKRKRNNLV
jgi:hypothetical protein